MKPRLHVHNELESELVLLGGLDREHLARLHARDPLEQLRQRQHLAGLQRGAGTLMVAIKAQRRAAGQAEQDDAGGQPPAGGKDRTGRSRDHGGSGRGSG